MKRDSKEFYEAQEAFEKNRMYEYSMERTKGEDRKYSFYVDGATDKYFRAFLLGIAYAECLYRLENHEVLK